MCDLLILYSGHVFKWGTLLSLNQALLLFDIFKKCSLSFNCSVLITSTYCIFLSSLPSNPSHLLFGMLFSGFLLLLFLDLIAIRES